MKFYARQRRTPSVIIVSLIDIFAILLIFVIVTTTFKTVQPEVVIKLPESETAQPSEETAEPIKITIDPKDRVYVHDVEVSLDQLGGRLRQELETSPKASLALNADTKASFGIIISVLDVLKKNGIDANVSALTGAAGQ